MKNPRASNQRHHAASSYANVWRRHDIFAYNPTYEWTSYKTTVGSILSAICVLFVTFYILLTTRDYIVRPPELTSQGDIDLFSLPPEQDLLFRLPKIGLRIAYVAENESTDDDDGVFDNSSNATTTTTTPTAAQVPGPTPDVVLSQNVNRTSALENSNPYVRFSIRHVWYRNQQRIRQTKLPLKECVVSNIDSLCPDIYDDDDDTIEDGLTNGEIPFPLQGVFFKEDYQFLEINVNKCVNDNADVINGELCAPTEDINESLHNGTLRVRVQVSMEAQQFDVEQFHSTGTGITLSNRSFEVFALPNLIVESNLVLKARIIQKEQRYLGSPPMPETEVNVLSFDRREITYRPRPTSGKRLMSFYIRLDDNVSLEEVSYWCPSILDLFGLWGAMTSFAASLSLGALALAYNRWRFHRHFAHVTHLKKTEARIQTLAAMEWIRNNKLGRDDHHKGDPHHHDGEEEKEEHEHHDRNVKGGGNAKKKGRQLIRKDARRDMLYSNLQAQYDALMVEPDIRLFESHHFDRHGRVLMSAAELKHPSTAFGELRKLALMEHGRKRRAAEFLSLWYARHLAKRGFFVGTPERIDALFTSDKSRDEEHDYYYQHRRRNNAQRGKSGFFNNNKTNPATALNDQPWTNLLRRRRTTSNNNECAPTSALNSNSDNRFQTTSTSADIEKGTGLHNTNSSGASTPPPSPHDNFSTASAGTSLSKHASEDNGEYSDREQHAKATEKDQVDAANGNVEQQRAMAAISAMDFAV